MTEKRKPFPLLLNSDERAHLTELAREAEIDSAAEYLRRVINALYETTHKKGRK